jgi:CRISPR/Cas system-associated exonuclease Cas4 (RecB family)
VIAMRLGIALVSRIVTGEECCLRKVQFSRRYRLPVSKELIEYSIKHEYLVSQIVNKCKSEVIVNKWVELDLEMVKLVGKIDILLMKDVPTIIEVKSGKERNSHHVQLWLYMLGYGNEVEGVLTYPVEKYWYQTDDIPVRLMDVIAQRVKPLLNDTMLPPVKGDHCRYCGYAAICEKENENERGRDHV